MKKLISIFIISLFCCTTLFAQPDIDWIHIYGWEDRWDNLWDVYLTEEGNLACCGSSKGHNNNQDGWLLLASDGGGQIFSRRYDGGHSENFASLIETDDGGFFMGGHQFTQEGEMGHAYVFAVLTDEDGEELWNRSIGIGDASHTSVCNAVIEAKSDEYLMTGYTCPDSNSAVSDGFLLALENDGELLWVQTYHVERSQRLQAIREVDGGYLLGGYTSNEDGNEDFWLVRTDEVGNMIWSREFGEGDLMERCWSLISCREGGWAMTGSGQAQPNIARLDREAQLDWLVHYERDQAYITRCIVQTPDNGFALVGWMFDVNDRDDFSFTLKVDSEGNEMWERLDNFAMPEAYFNSTVISTDGSIIAAGSIITAENRQECQGLLVKLFPEFSPPEIVEYTPKDTMLTVLQGDTVDFWVSAHDAQNDELHYLWIIGEDTLSTDTTITHVFDELGDFEMQCQVSDGEFTVGITWHVRVMAFYIESFTPDTLEMTVRRDNSVDFALEVRTLEDVEFDYLWTLIGRGQQRQVGEEESVSVLFDLTGDHRLEGMVWSDEAADVVDWAIHVRSVIWYWWPEENELSIPVDTRQEFAVFPFDPDSDSLSFLWYLNDEQLAVEDTMFVVTVDFPDVGNHTLASIVHDGCEVDTVTWEIEVFDPRGTTSDDVAPLPETVALFNPRPNPFNAATTISYQLPEPGEVSIGIYDIHGRLVTMLVEGKTNAGFHSVVWDGNNVPSGIYLCHMRAPGYSRSVKMVLVK